MKKFVFILFVFISVAAFAEEKRVPSSMGEVTLSYAPLVKKAAPAVVNIYTKKKIKVKGISPLFNDPFFQQFMGEGFEGFQKEKMVNSLGSGVIVKPEGLIVTNNHVIKGSDEITIILSDKREFEADIVLTDPKTDMALLKVRGDVELPYIEMDNSDDLEVGDVVLAIGNPFGIGQTVTQGIVSAIARTTVGISDLQFFIQTDAAINPGNSGGALINMHGKLVGINSAIYSRTGGSNGIGFAIPSNMVKTVVGGEKTGGKVMRPWLGVQAQTVTQEIAESIGLLKPSGVVIKKIHEKSPVFAAGLKTGDIIMEIDGKEITDEQTLRFRVATYPVGATANIKIFREGEQYNRQVVMESPPENIERATTKVSGRHPLSGATISNLSPAVAEEIGVDADAEGVVVVNVEEGSVATSLGIRPGDIITSVNNQEIRNVSELKSILNLKPHAGWAFVIKRGEETISLTVRL